MFHCQGSRIRPPALALPTTSECLPRHICVHTSVSIPPNPILLHISDMDNSDIESCLLLLEKLCYSVCLVYTDIEHDATLDMYHLYKA